MFESDIDFNVFGWGDGTEVGLGAGGEFGSVYFSIVDKFVKDRVDVKTAVRKGWYLDRGVGSGVRI